MRRIELIDLSINNDGQYYWLRSKHKFKNGLRPKALLLEYISINLSYEPPHFGSNKLWAHEENNVAFDNYEIYGPVPMPNWEEK